LKKKYNKSIAERAYGSNNDYWYAILYAFICGICIYISQLNRLERHNIDIAIGVGIGTSLLPPLVNAGLLIADQEYDFAYNSFYLTVINMIGLVGGMVVTALVYHFVYPNVKATFGI
jgi:uncharacterized membrane protein